MTPLQQKRCDVLILGAGMAGLAAARALAESGCKPVVLEARDRVGGRVLTEHTAEGALVEHGAEFIHGRDPELWKLIEESGAKAIEREGPMLTEEHAGGGLAAGAEEQDEELFSTLETLSDLPDDVSFTEWLAGSNVPPAQHQDFIGYVEGFNAADANLISAQALGVQQRAEDAQDGDRAWHLPGGYNQLPEFLASRARERGAEIVLGCRVYAIRWRPGAVVVSTSQGDFRAAHCIITLPLGVLQAANASAPESVRIEPEPKALFEARRLAMGHVVRFTLVFRERWWENLSIPGVNPDALRSASFIFSRERMPPVWWTRHPEPERLPSIVGWCGGPRAEALQAKSETELGWIACRELAGIFGVPEKHLRSLLVDTHTFDWSADPFARGAYSYVPACALDAPEAMAQPQAKTLFFAGEHTDTSGHWGTVHAALATGLRAARQVEELRN